MKPYIKKAISEPIRNGLSTEDRWNGRDQGLIGCWEKGREKGAAEPDLRQRALAGELMELCWARGNENYLAYHQGLRGVDLEVDPANLMVLTCSATGWKYAFCGDKEERQKLQQKLDRERLANKE